MRILIVLAALLFLSSCASSGFNATAQRTFPPYEGEVEVLRKLPRNGTYELVGIVRVKGVALTSDERMFEELKARAAYQGADAVIPQGAIRTRPKSDGGEDRTLAAYAIRRR